MQVLAKNDITVDMQRSALAVDADAVRRGPVTEIVFADGNAQAIRKEFLRFENAGRVAFLKSNDDGGPLREGDVVKSGELLAELDRRIDDAAARAARAELDTVRAALANAKGVYERAKRLRDGGSIQASLFEGIETSYKQALAEMRGAEARLDQARAGLRQLQIRAPFDGLVAFVNVREGQYVSPDQFSTDSQRGAASASPIVIIDPSSFETIVELPVVSGRRVAAGQTAYILDEGTLAHVQENGYTSLQDVDSIDDLLIVGRVASVSPAIDPSSRSVRARIVTDEEVEGLTDGGYVTAWIETARRENALIAPLESLIFRGANAYSFVIDPDTHIVERRAVSIGLTGQEGIEVTEGLREGDVVVTKGRYRLTTGMRVRPNIALETTE
jgi:multidrug efflux pump subunit AcrA (membrane-fusion protein)